MNIYSTSLDFLQHNSICDFIINDSKKHVVKLKNYTLLVPTQALLYRVSKSFLKLNSNDRPSVICIADNDELLRSALKGATPLLSDKIQKLKQKTLITSQYRAYTLSVMMKLFDSKLDFSDTISACYQLGEVIDKLEAEDINLEAITIKSQHSYYYSQRFFNFFKLAKKHFKLILKEQNLINLFDYKNQVLTVYNEAVTSMPKDHHIVAFGINTHYRTIIQLLKTIASTSTGKVILNGFDNSLSANELLSLSASHPQYKHAQVLIKTDLINTSVKPILGINSNISKVRNKLLSSSFNKAPDVTFLESQLASLIANLFCLTFKDNKKEALGIANLIKQELHYNAKSKIAIVTSNLDLTQQIIFELRVFQIKAVSTYGTTLVKSYNSSFFSLLSSFKGHNINFIAISAIIKSSLYTQQFNTENSKPYNTIVNLIDLHLLRQVTVEQSFIELESLWQSISKYILAKNTINQEEQSAVTQLLSYMASSYQEFHELTEKPTFSFKKALTLHMLMAEKLSYNEEESTIWQGEYGLKLYEVLSQTLANAQNIDDVSFSEYQSIIRDVLVRCHIRKYYDYSENLNVIIYGLQQSEFITSDLTIIADLNEGSFPQARKSDKWYINYLKPYLDNISQESEELGDSAAIFSKLCQNPKVYLTRSLRKDGLLTVESRFLTKLKNNILANHYQHDEQALFQNEGLRKFLHMHLPSYEKEQQPILSPYLTLCDHNAPNPEVVDRPKSISITEIESLLKNPYVFFVNKVLLLKPLDEIGEAINKRLYGNLVHKGLDKSVEQLNKVDYYNYDYKQIEKIAHASFNKVLYKYKHHPLVNTFWVSKFNYIITAWSKFLSANLANIKVLSSEVKLSYITSKIPSEAIQINGRADLVMFDSNNDFNIIDYKTSNINMFTYVSISKYHKQLILLSHIIQSQNNSSYQPSKLSYMFFPEKLNTPIIEKNLQQLLKFKVDILNYEHLQSYLEEDVQETIAKISTFLLQKTPFLLNTEDKKIFTPYAHFARITNN